MKPLCSLAAAIVLVALICSSAGAATVSYKRYVDSETDDGGGGITEFHQIVVTAGRGERNDLLVEAKGATVTVTDAGAPLTVGPMCRRAAANRVTCLVEGKEKDPKDPSIEFTRDVYASVSAGDGDDRLRVGRITPVRGVLGLRGDVTLYGGTGDDTVMGGARNATAPTLDGGPGRDLVLAGSGPALLFGGTGSDVLRGGPKDDVLDGEAYNVGTTPPVEADAIDGGPGRDLVTYESRKVPVRVDLGAGGPAGAVGENDTLVSVENVRGGSDDNVLIGDDGPNELMGSGVIEGTVDRLEGRGGDDDLDGDAGRNELVGGDGDDVLRGASALLSCGSGDDAVHPTERPAESGDLSDCERLFVDFGATLRIVPARVTSTSITFRYDLEPKVLKRDGRLTLRLRGSGALLGTARVRLATGRTDVRVALTPAGRRAFAGGRSADVTVAHTGSHSDEDVRYGLTLRAG